MTRDQKQSEIVDLWKQTGKGTVVACTGLIVDQDKIREFGGSPEVDNTEPSEISDNLEVCND